MNDYVLVLNAGSSSLKFCVFHQPPNSGWTLETRGQIQGIGTAPRLIARDSQGNAFTDTQLERDILDGRDALNRLAVWLRSMYRGAHVVGVGHRVVHGGATFTGPTVITPDIVAALRRLVPLAPLHQPYNLAAINAVSEHSPGVPQVACFDTSFHHGRPAVSEVIPLPPEIRGKGVRRYGFHGLSYEYVAGVLPEIAPEIADRRVVVAHLGSGASLCALRNRKSVDCTTGFTALDGLCMGTRPGSLDPGVVLYLFQCLGLSVKEVEAVLYKRSGLLGLSGISSDAGELLKSTDPAARSALDYFVYRVAKEIGAMAAALGGIDGLVFTAGIGENSPEVRRRICKSCEWLGIELDEDANRGNRSSISKRTSVVSVWVIPTNEDLMIARHTGVHLGLIPAHA